MPRKRKQTVSPGRIALFVVLIQLVLAAAWAWQHRSRLRSAVSTVTTELPLPVQGGSSQTSAGAAAVPARANGKLAIRHAAHDTQLGVAADAIALLRIVEMYQWTEHCDG